MMSKVFVKTLCTAEQQDGNKIVFIQAPLFTETGCNGAFLKESLTGAIAGVKSLSVLGALGVKDWGFVFSRADVLRCRAQVLDSTVPILDGLVLDNGVAD